MTGKEYCRYIRTYSELEGLQRAHTVVYCAQTVPGGVLAQLRWEQAGRVQCSTVLAPQGSFARMMQLLRYLCENSAPALPVAAGSTAARRHPPGERLFLWHLLILYR